MDYSTIFMLFWLVLKVVVDTIGLIFIFWRLVHRSQPYSGKSRHKGDFYFISWLVIKFFVDGVFNYFWYVKNIV